LDVDSDLWYALTEDMEPTTEDTMSGQEAAENRQDLHDAARPKVPQGSRQSTKVQNEAQTQKERTPQTAQSRGKSASRAKQRGIQASSTVVAIAQEPFINRLARERGFDVMNVPGDGNCSFP